MERTVAVRHRGCSGDSRASGALGGAHLAHGLPLLVLVRVHATLLAAFLVTRHPEPRPTVLWNIHHATMKNFHPWRPWIKVDAGDTLGLSIRLFHHGSSLVLTWFVSLVPYGFMWVLTDHYGSVWVLTSFLGPYMSLHRLMGSGWVRRGGDESLLVGMGRYGSVLMRCIGPYSS
jgi:hypothetical protein